jgi:hypothetical protein
LQHPGDEGSQTMSSAVWYKALQHINPNRIGFFSNYLFYFSFR